MCKLAHLSTSPRRVCLHSPYETRERRGKRHYHSWLFISDDYTVCHGIYPLVRQTEWCYEKLYVSVTGQKELPFAKRINSKCNCLSRTPLEINVPRDA